LARRRLLALSVVAGAAFLVGRLLPASGIGLWLRLASATTLLFAPGVCVAAALGLPLAAGALAWSLAFVGIGLAAMFAVQGSLWLALGVAALTAGVAVVAVRRNAQTRAGVDQRIPASAFVALAGIALGALLWPVTAALSGDALFHLARVRKLVAFGSLSLRSVDEFRDGGLHPGYAFPLWHGVLAVVARVADVDPALIVRREPTVLVAVAFAVAYEAGFAVFRSVSLGLAVLVVQVVLFAIAPGHGGAFTSLALPATAARQLLLPALFALFFHRSREAPRPRSLPYLLVGLVAAELALIHVTYALFAVIVLVGFFCVRALFRSDDLTRDAGRLGAVLAGTGAVGAWLAPIAAATRSHNPGCAEIRRAFVNYHGQLIHSSCSHYRLAPAMVTRSGAIAIAALLLVPVAAFAIRREWSALVLGGTVAILVLLLPPWVFPHFADVVSISQARRAAGFVPIPFALVGGVAVLSGRSKLGALAVALAAGIALEFIYPGWFETTAPTGAPSYPAWVALIGGAAALLAARVFLSEWAQASGRAVLAAVVLLVVPAAIRGISEWTPTAAAASAPLSSGLVNELRRPALRGTIVYADPATSYAVAAYAPVYVATAPPSHVANTVANDPYRRWDDAIRFLHTGSLAIPRRYHACTILLRRPARVRPRLPVVYRDRGFVLYALERRCG
jgi:hypothetical protein